MIRSTKSNCYGNPLIPILFYLTIIVVSTGFYINDKISHKILFNSRYWYLFGLVFLSIILQGFHWWTNIQKARAAAASKLEIKFESPTSSSPEKGGGTQLSLQGSYWSQLKDWSRKSKYILVVLSHENRSGYVHICAKKFFPSW